MNVSPVQTALVPTEERLLAISMSRTGDLRDVPFALLLRAMAEHQRSGVLEISRGPLSKSIALENGIPVDCQSNLVHERLGRFMVANGKLSEPDFARCLSESLKDEVPLGQVLIRRKLVNASELYRLLQQNLAKKLLDGFSWHEGEYQFSNEMAEVESPLKVRVHQLILTGVMRFASQERIDLLVMTLLGEKLALHPAPPVDPLILRLNTAQRLVLDKLSVRPLEMSKLAEAARLELTDLSRLVYAYVTLGFVGPVRELKTVKKAPATASTGALPETISTLPPEELVALFLAHRRKDAFDLLELPETATPRDIELAYLNYARQLAPWAYSTEEGLRDKASDLFLAGARAFATLADRTQRENVLTRRRNETKKKTEQPETSFRIETDLLDPEVQFGKGQALTERGNYHDALQYLEFAADCDPQNGLYRSELAYCRYILRPSDAEDSLRRLSEAMRIDRTCGEAWYYSGQILKDLERWSEAEEMLQTAIRPMSPDRRPIEALKELTRVRKKKRR